MKILVIGNEDRYKRYLPDLDIARTADAVYVPLDASVEDMLAAAGDADILFADAIAKVPAELINGMPQLKLINSEGVGFNGFAIDAASARGIYVCNNPGANASAVAEQTVLLMLGLLRDVIFGHNMELAGKQMEVKQQKMREGITELSQLTVGLMGFGNIAKAVALRLKPFSCRICFYNRTRRPEDEEKYGAEYLPLDELAAQSDILSIHMAVNEQTAGIVDRRLLSLMKPTAYFINTSRGELVNNEDLKWALENGVIAGAGLDTISPEPTLSDNPLLNIDPACGARILYSPHIGGLTGASFARCHRQMWENAARIEAGERPEHILNKL